MVAARRPVADSIAPVRLPSPPAALLRDVSARCDLMKTTAQMKRDLAAEVRGMAERGVRRPLSEEDLAMRQLPPEVAAFGRFMLYQSSRDLGPRDVVKAYTITRSSIQRGAVKGSTLRNSWYNHPFADDAQVRPEDAFAWVLRNTNWGQSYLINAQKGRFDETAALAIARMLRAFGLTGLGPDGYPDPRPTAQRSGFYYDLKRGSELSEKSREVLGVLRAGSREDWIRFATGFHGIAFAKAGFIGALLGRGDVPTGDARELVLWARGKINRDSDREMRAFVTQLGTRLRQLQVGMEPELRPFYEHLVHHYLWDLAGGTATTHAELLACLAPLSGLGALAVGSDRALIRAYVRAWRRLR